MARFVDRSNVNPFLSGCQRICVDLLDDPPDALLDRQVREDFYDAAPIGKRSALQHG